MDIDYFNFKNKLGDLAIFLFKENDKFYIFDLVNI